MPFITNQKVKPVISMDCPIILRNGEQQFAHLLLADGGKQDVAVHLLTVVILVRMVCYIALKKRITK